MKFTPIVKVGFSGYEIDTAISMEAANLSAESAREIRDALINSVAKFDEFRRTYPPERPAKREPWLVPDNVAELKVRKTDV